LIEPEIKKFSLWENLDGLMKILHLDTNHPLLISQLTDLGFENDSDYDAPKEVIEDKIHEYDGIIIRSRFKIGKSFLKKATKLKFIGRVGAGLENINIDFAKAQGITLISAPEGNRNAVGEHALGLLLSLLNNLHVADAEIREGKWLRETNRGVELDGKTVGILGYGNMGKAFAKKLLGFDVDVICYDINDYVGDKHARQVSFEDFLEQSDVLSLHTPQTELTLEMVNAEFINQFKKPFWFINTARGKSVVTKDLVAALESGKILGAGLDVLEYEKSSFEDMFSSATLPDAFDYLIKAPNVILSPHVAGWTKESQVKLAQTIVDKIKIEFC
jgi:D-3-phosphoglycerate dehydrogenase